MKTTAEPEPIPNDRIRTYWHDLTEEEIDWIHGEPTKLMSALSDKYGLSRDEAGRQVEAFLREGQAN